MKRILAAMLALMMLMGAALAEVTLPEDSCVYSVELAMEVVAWANSQSREGTEQVLTQEGFEILLQNNYDKEMNDASHTCAYTLARKTVTYQGRERTLFAVVIRGTAEGEWYSNFDFSVSRSNAAVYAENFLFAAQDVQAGILDILLAEEEPLILVTGHSRGAACANLLGVLLDTRFDTKDVFVYTSATPTTIRGGMTTYTWPNIFNIIHPCDIVPMMPLLSLGFERAGTDILLPCDEAEKARIEAGMQVLSQLAPDIESYYNVRHSLKGPGTAEDGMTAFEMMSMLSASLVDPQKGGMMGGPMDEGAAQSDFAPLFGLLARLSAEDGKRMGEIAAYHMPFTYLAGLEATQEK